MSQISEFNWFFVMLLLLATMAVSYLSEVL